LKCAFLAVVKMSVCLSQSGNVSKWRIVSLGCNGHLVARFWGYWNLPKFQWDYPQWDIK